MKRSTALLRLVGVALLLGVILSGSLPGLASADPDPCPNCFVGGLCRPCEDGGAQPCQTRTCCGVTRITVCGTCVLHCVPPP